MRQLIQFCSLMAMCGGLASASIIFSTPCSVLEGPNAGALSSSVCSATADPGFFINSVTVTITSDYAGWQSGTPTVTTVYSFVQNTPGLPAPIPNGVVTTTIMLSGQGNSNPIQNYNQIVNGNFGGVATVRFSMSNSVAGGAVTGVSGVTSITATEAPVGTIPESSTMLLLGSGLIGLGVIKRRRKI